MTRIAYIDDNPNILKTCLENKIKNLEIVCFSEPSILIKRLEEDEEFSLILSDVDMSKMNGIELSEKINESVTHAPPIVLVTNNEPDTFDINELMNSGIIDIIKKPNTLTEYDSLVKKIRILILMHNKWLKKQKEIELKHIKNIEKFTNLINYTKNTFIILNEDFTVRECSHNLSEIINADINKLIGKEITELVVNEDVKKLKNSLERLDSGVPIEDLELCLNTQNSTINRWISLNANSLINGQKTIFCLVKDITDKKMEYFQKYIQEQKQKDRLKQNINNLREKLQSKKRKYD